MPIAQFARAPAAFTERCPDCLDNAPRPDAPGFSHLATKHTTERRRGLRVAAQVQERYMRDNYGEVESMRAETQNLVEEIKQSVRLLRRHL
jgi:hypothetical protein